MYNGKVAIQRLKVISEQFRKFGKVEKCQTKKIPKYLVLKGWQDFCGAYGAANNP